MAEKTGAEKPPESPTTARELDFDDDNDAPATATATATATESTPGVRFQDDAHDIPPPKPPRPMSPQQQAQNTLIEAFPAIDASVVKAVLVASGGKVEPAFNALLSMSDPNFTAEDMPPPQPPRPQRSQVEQDEMYARQLAEHYQTRSAGSGERRQRPRRPTEQPDERSFFDDDLPEIRKNIEQGFKETQKTVTGWLTTLTKKLDGEPDEYDRYGNPVYPGSQRPNPPSTRHNFGPSQSADQRRSADHTRYDADNTVLADDFAQLELRDNEAPPRSSTRPHANPHLFKSTTVAPPQTGPVDEVDALYRNPSPTNQPAHPRSGANKWQPLTSVAPHPEPQDHDPFSLGDSDDEDNKTKDTNPADTERLKKAASNKDSAPASDLKPAERSGSISQKDATAEALLKDAK